VTAIDESVRGDRDSHDWWRALANHELLVQTCEQCAVHRWPPRAMCNRCGAMAWQWTQASGTGRVVSWIVNRHAFSRDLAIPSVVLLVRLDEQDDLILPGAYAGPPDGGDLEVGAKVTVRVGRTVDDEACLVWALAGDGAA
jgi:uncharacterized protein